MNIHDLSAVENQTIHEFVRSCGDHLTGRVLDYGCGKRPYRQIVEDMGGTYTGYDRREFGGNVSGRDIGKFGGEFDAILCTQVLAYVHEVGEVLFDMREMLLNSEGWLVLTYPGAWPVIRDELWHFTQHGMTALLEQAGFTVERHELRHSVGFDGVVYPDGIRRSGPRMMSGELQLAIEQRIMGGTTFMGVPALKNPMDAWVYQEIIWEQRPDVIVEIGNRAGGSLLYLATICDLLGHGEVVGVDNDRAGIQLRATDHRRLSLVTGDAVAVFPRVQNIVMGRSCLVIEDSAHTYEHTLAVLDAYGSLVHPGGYMICEDGVMPEVARALKMFALTQTEFVADTSREWPVTWKPGGYLRRIVQP